MTHVCLVILIRHVHSIFIMNSKISLHNEVVFCCWRKFGDRFYVCSPDTRRLDIDELTVAITKIFVSYHAIRVTQQRPFVN